MTALRIGLGAALVLVIAAFFRPQAVAQGWLLAFVLGSCAPMGAIALLLIHRLTGGRWGEAAGPGLIVLARQWPWTAGFFLPIALMMPQIFPWTAAPSPGELGRFYLNAPAYVARSAVLLAGLSWLAQRVTAGRCSRLLAGLGLAFYATMLTPIAADWLLAVEPGFGSSALGMQFAAMQMLMALAVVALIGTGETTAQDRGDIGALLIAMLLGVVYIELMTFIVNWYGDLPPKSAWYLQRSHPAWIAVIVGALICGAVLPMALLTSSRWRRDAAVLRIAGALILIGSVLDLGWIVAPALVPGAIAAAVLALVAMLTLPALHRDRGWRAAHG